MFVYDMYECVKLLICYLSCKMLCISYHGNTLFWWSFLSMQLTISNFATIRQLTLIRVLVDCLLNICKHFIVMVLQKTLYWL